MQGRFIEAVDDAETNWGKFLLLRIDACDAACPSAVSGSPLLASFPLHARLGPVGEGTLWLLDLQTQEGCAFEPGAPASVLEARFLEHPIKVCILFFPLMRWLSSKPPGLA